MTLQSLAPGVSVPSFAADGAQYSGTLDGQSFVSYCAEITQYLYFNTTYTDYTIVSGVTAWGPEKSALLDHLISAIFDQHINTTSLGSGLAQAVLWETLYETSANPGFADGSFTLSHSNNIDIASNTFDWTSATAWPVDYHADLLRSPSAQDLFLIRAVTVTVPEPTAPMLLIIGVAGLGLMKRRRRRSR